MRTRTSVSMILRLLIAASALVGGLQSGALAAGAPPPVGDRMPPRLSLTEGDVGFWRPGADDWAQAQVNTPLTPGDQLTTGAPATAEIQIGPRAFVRASANTQLALDSQDADFLQFRMTGGDVSFDVRGLDPGQTLEVETPSAAFTIATPGYYRVTVAADRTSFVARRGGRATAVPAVGNPVTVTSSDELVIEGPGSPMLTSYVAPPLDEWDSWNYRRTEELLESVSSRYVTPGTYGVDDLDQYGAWRVVPTYGAVWVPLNVPAGWAPYSTGSWVADPYYGWTWVDTAPWGWAPYHHGRWVFLDGYWAWTPGPPVARAVYAPALVAFFGGAVAVGGPVFGWVALGWGEPVVPWWGAPGPARVPSWRGWGGPRVVNNVVITNTTTVTVASIRVYRNAGVQHGVVAVHEHAFGRGHIAPGRVREVEVSRLRPIHAAPHVAPAPASFAPSATRGIRPPDEALRRGVVATRPPHHVGGSPGADPRPAPSVVPPAPAPRGPAAREREASRVLPRAPFGASTVERPAPARPEPAPRQPDAPGRGSHGSGPPQVQTPPAPAPHPAPPSARAADTPAPPSSPQARPPATGPARPQPAPAPRGGATPAPAAPPHAAPPHTPSATPLAPPAAPPAHPQPAPAARAAVPPAAPGALPGVPANRLAPYRGEPRRPERDDRGDRERHGRGPDQPEGGSREHRGK